MVNKNNCLFLSEFGSVGDGIALETMAIQKAIDKCCEQNMTLIINKGIYKTGTLYLRDNTTMFFEQGAKIIGSDNIDDYPDNPASFVDAVGQKRGKTLILGYQIKNVKIEGLGEINGQGEKFDEMHPAHDIRPFLVRLVKCTQISISGLHFKNSAAWCLHFRDCLDVNIDKIDVYNRCNSNNDGIDIDSSRNIAIKNIRIDSGDDALCLKSTGENSCENVSIEDSYVSSGWAGFKIGTESVGDIKHITVRKCVFEDILGCGIKIVPTDGARVEDVKIQDVKMINCTGPIFIACGERLRKYAGIGRNDYSKIKDITIENIVADVISAPVRGLYLGEIWGNAVGGVIVSGTNNNHIENIVFNNLVLSLPGGITQNPNIGDVVELREQYPEFHLFDIVPAKGIFIRNANTVFLEQIKISFKKTDIRELVFFKNVTSIYQNDVQELNIEESK